MPMSQNRTKWPVRGGAIAIQPGWFAGHATAFFYINLGFGTNPLNWSHPMLPVFQITGPTREMYAGTFCLPQVPLPANTTVKVGDNATIQIIETAVHGAALFNVSILNPGRRETAWYVNDDVTDERIMNSASTSHSLNLTKSPKSMKATASIRPPSGSTRCIPLLRYRLALHPFPPSSRQHRRDGRRCCRY